MAIAKIIQNSNDQYTNFIIFGISGITESSPEYSKGIEYLDKLQNSKLINYQVDRRRESIFFEVNKSARNVDLTKIPQKFCDFCNGINQYEKEKSGDIKNDPLPKEGRESQRSKQNPSNSVSFDIDRSWQGTFEYQKALEYLKKLVKNHGLTYETEFTEDRIYFDVKKTGECDMDITKIPNRFRTRLDNLGRNNASNYAIPSDLIKGLKIQENKISVLVEQRQKKQKDIMHIVQDIGDLFRAELHKVSVSLDTESNLIGINIDINQDEIEENRGIKEEGQPDFTSMNVAIAFLSRMSSNGRVISRTEFDDIYNLINQNKNQNQNTFHYKNGKVIDNNIEVVKTYKEEAPNKLVAASRVVSEYFPDICGRISFKNDRSSTVICQIDKPSEPRERVIFEKKLRDGLKEMRRPDDRNGSKLEQKVYAQIYDGLSRSLDWFNPTPSR